MREIPETCAEQAVHAVRLPSGTVIGEIRGGILRFADVPYAAPPVGELRFAPPQPVPPWEGIRVPSCPRASAPQRVGSVPGLDVGALIGRGWVPGDDYLTLNIWRPAEAATPLPVMVYIYGGGFITGSKDAPVQDGTSFARSGTLCIAINYRLGIDGFLPIPGIPTNLGLRDMIAALEWIREHVAAFGGDPGNVTVFGESAGAMAIANLITSPLADGLFHRAIVQSGHGAMTRDIPVARRLVAKLANILGVSPDKPGFMKVAPGDALDAVEKVSLPTTRIDLRNRDGHEPVFGISRFIPVHGDDVLPLPPLEALKRGACADVQLMIGTNLEEMNLYLVPTGLREKIGRLTAWLALRRSHPRAWQVLKAYGMGQGVRPCDAFCAALNDLVFRWPARRFAEEYRGRTHMYEFDWRSTAFDGQLGAAHAVEIPFVFDTLACGTGPEGVLGEDAPQMLADRIHRIWADFARDGTVPWPAFTREARHVHRLAADETILEAPMPAAPFLP